MALGKSVDVLKTGWVDGVPEVPGNTIVADVIGNSAIQVQISFAIS